VHFFHAYHTVGYPWVTRTLSQYSSLEEWWGFIQPLQSSRYIGIPDPINLACGQYIIKCSFKGPLRMVLNRHRRGLPPWSLEYPSPSPQPSQPMILHFPLVAPPGLKFKSSIHSFQFLTILIPLEVKRILYVSGTNHSSSTVSYN
jgi:hypothetical protein